MESQLDAHNKQEQAKLEASNRALKRLQRKLRQKDIEEFRGNEEIVNDDAESSSESESAQETGRQQSQPTQRPGSSRGRPGTSRGGADSRVKGNLQYEEESSDSDSDSDLSDSDLSGDEGEDDDDDLSEGSFGDDSSGQSGSENESEL